MLSKEGHGEGEDVSATCQVELALLGHDAVRDPVCFSVLRTQRRKTLPSLAQILEALGFPHSSGFSRLVFSARYP